MAQPVRAIWEEILNRFQNYDRIVAPEWRAERAESPAHEIVNLLKRPIKNHPKVLLSGTVGTGKSTELQRIAEKQAQNENDFVIFLDLASHFYRVVGDIQALQHVSSWEVCFLSGLALLRAAKEILGYDFPPDQIAQLANAWTNIAKASQESSAALPSIDILSLIKSMTLKASQLLPVAASSVGMLPQAASTVAGGLAILSEMAGAGKWTLPIGRTSTKILEDQEEVMQTLIDQINLLFLKFSNDNGRRVILVVDGLDRIANIEHSCQLFLRSDMISRLECAQVICAPFALRNNMAASEAKGYRLSTLHNAPVLNHDHPNNLEKPGAGVDFLCEVFRCRVKDLDAENIVPEKLLKQLAYYSGGRARDFVKNIGMLAERGWDNDSSVATEAEVNDVLKEARKLVETGLDRGHITVLEGVMRDPSHRLPESPLARELLTYSRLLSYPNESEWFYPHPLLTLSLLQP